MTKINLKYGLLLGIISIIFYLINLNVFQLKLNYNFKLLFNIGLFIVIPIIATLRIKKFNNNIITYSAALKSMLSTFIIGLSISYLLEMVTHLFYPNVDIMEAVNSGTPYSGLESRLEIQYQSLEQLLTDDSLDIFTDTFLSFLGNSLLFIIITAVISLFLRTKTPSLPNTSTN